MYSIMNMIRAFQISVSTRRQKAGVYMLSSSLFLSLSFFFVLDLFSGLVQETGILYFKISFS